MTTFRTIPLVFLLLCLALSCKKLIQYHPSEVRPSQHNLNFKNIQLIKALPVRDTFSFIVISDTQRFYDELEDFIKHVNTLRDISFVLINGDITDFGLNAEFNLIADKLINLRMPYIAVIGNHDMLGNGELVYREMFGPEDFSFSYGPNKFILFNSNSREVGYNGTLPDTAWLRGATADAEEYQNIFFVSHVPPFSGDFDKNLEISYASLVASVPGSRLSIHGHQHDFSYRTRYNNHFPYLVVSTIGKRNYAKVTLKGKEMTVTQISF